MVRCPGFSALKNSMSARSCFGASTKASDRAGKEPDMKTNKKLRLSMLVLALVLAMTVLFCSCEQKPIDPPQTTPAETTEEPLPATRTAKYLFHV